MTETPPTTPVVPKPRRRWGKLVLFVSLALNLAVVGMVAGAFLGGPHDRDGSSALRDLGFGPFVYALPREDKREIDVALKREAGSFRDNRAEIKRQFEGFLAALRADPFDNAEVERLIGDQRSRIGERQRLGQRLLMERIRAMDARKRGDYADKLDSLLRRRHDRP